MNLKCTVFLLVVVSAFSLAATNSLAKGGGDAGKVYRYDDLKLKIQFPETYKVQKSANHVAGKQKNGVSFAISFRPMKADACMAAFKKDKNAARSAADHGKLVRWKEDRIGNSETGLPAVYALKQAKGKTGPSNISLKACDYKRGRYVTVEANFPANQYDSNLGDYSNIVTSIRWDSKAR